MKRPPEVSASAFCTMSPPIIRRTESTSLGFDHCCESRVLVLLEVVAAVSAPRETTMLVLVLAEGEISGASKARATAWRILGAGIVRWYPEPLVRTYIDV